MTSQTGGKPVDTHEEFILEQEDVEIYKKSKQLVRWADIPTGLFSSLGMFTFLLFLISYTFAPFLQVFSIAPLTDFLFAPSLDTDIRIILSAVATGGFILFFSFSLAKWKFLSNARKTGVHQQNFRLHVLSEGISAFRRDDHEQAISRLEKFSDLTRHHVPPSWDSIINTYIQNLRNEDDDEYITDTYEDFVSVLMEELLDRDDRREEMLKCITTRDPSEFTENTEVTTMDTKHTVTYLDIVRQSFSDYNPARYKPHFWLVYGLAAIVGFSVFYFVNDTLGLLIVAMLAPALQVYGKNDRKEEENG